jgi:hypothetical protein
MIIIWGGRILVRLSGHCNQWSYLLDRLKVVNKGNTHDLIIPSRPQGAHRLNRYSKLSFLDENHKIMNYYTLPTRNMISTNHIYPKI